jgi:hypothetical protein
MVEPSMHAVSFAVVLDLMQPARRGWCFLAQARQLRLNPLGRMRILLV